MLYIGSLEEATQRTLFVWRIFSFRWNRIVNIILADKKIAFVSYTDISSSLKAVEYMWMEVAVDELIWKDRCANPARAKSFGVSPPSSPIE
jgi:hypothetical protein